ncbi:hypothetical protein [Tenacibaculum dicentrarchi]|uniref:hypothetical protein n=1 Tax=Tenacibaculum dicentrarchi TaxID=669041 RepID=UPI00351926FE
MKKYVLIEKDVDVHAFSFNKISPVLKVEKGVLFFNNRQFELKGLSIEEWLINNKNLLLHTIESGGKYGSNKEVYSYNEKMILKEIPLDEDEDFFINYKIDEQTYKKDISQLNLLLTDLEKLFYFIEPDKLNEENFSVFLRELIIKSSTEVETHWKELMKLNGYKKQFLTTKDYSKLMEFINFNFHLKLENFPSYEEIIPFSNWNIENPTKSLEWYNVYNKLKHDRTNSLNTATLKNGINAVGAVFILVHIRYNKKINNNNNEINNVFKISKTVKTSKLKIYSHYKSLMKVNYLKYFEKQ